MSIYTTMSKDAPVYAMTDWLGATPGVAARTLLRHLLERSTALQEAAVALRTSWGNDLTDAIAKSTHRMRGMLSQFLSMPLTSDTKEIQGILDDQVRQVVEQVLPALPVGLLGIQDGRLIADAGSHASTKKLADAGKRLLGGGPLRRSKTGQEVYENAILLQGGLNLDILHVLRSGVKRTEDALPVHIRTGILMLKYRHGELNSGSDRHETILLFDAQSLDHETILGSCSMVASEWGSGHVSVWEDLTRPHELLVRFRSTDRTGIRDAMDELIGSRFPSTLTGAIKKTGRLIHKDLSAGAGEPD